MYRNKYIRARIAYTAQQDGTYMAVGPHEDPFTGPMAATLLNPLPHTMTVVSGRADMLVHRMVGDVVVVCGAVTVSLCPTHSDTHSDNHIVEESMGYMGKAVERVCM